MKNPIADLVQEILDDDALTPESAIRIIRAIWTAMRSTPDVDPEKIVNNARQMRAELTASDARHDDALAKKFDQSGDS